jgi:RNA polymerase sigma factor (sigma-70 family)
MALVLPRRTDRLIAGPPPELQFAYQNRLRQALAGYDWADAPGDQVMHGARSRSTFLLDDVGFRRCSMTGGTVEDSLATRAGRLFAEYRDGDDAKMGDLVRVLTPILWHTARSSRLDAATAEDVLQTVWLTLVRKSDTITEPLAVLQWLVVSTKREAWRVARNLGRFKPEDLESSAAANNGESIEDAVLRDENDDRLWRHIEGLPERCRTLLRVIAFADRPDYAELAKALGMPQGSIGPTRGRCLAKLRLALAQDPTWEHQ